MDGDCSHEIKRLLLLRRNGVALIVKESRMQCLGAMTKETISKVKRQPSEWEKIIANEATDKELI